ncbi:MAG: M28 family peptidase [Planctomycetota bacterium]
MDLFDSLLDRLLPAIDVNRLEKGIHELSAIERPTDADSFEAAAAYTRDAYAAAGLRETVPGSAGIRRFPADGKTDLGTYTAPIGFRTRTAVCTLLGPGGARRVLGDRAREPNTAILGTGHTGPQGLQAEAVLIQNPAAITADRVRGKIVFTPNLHPQSIRNPALAAGARAVVSSQMERDARDFVRWHNTWDSQPDGWHPTAQAAAENFPGISLAPVVGDELLRAFQAGLVRLEIVTEGEYFSGTFPAVDLRRPAGGEFDQEVLLSGHLFEQGAMDNASGVIACIHAAELLGIGITAQRPQRRAVRAFHSHECYGVLALHATDPHAVDRAIAHLNVDSIGCPASPLKVGRGLNATAGATDLVFTALARRISERLDLPLDWWDEFTINCTLIAEPALGGVPTSFIDQPHPSWHTSRDRNGIFKFSPPVLKQAALIAAAWTAFFATAGSDEARALAELLLADAPATLAAAADTALALETCQRQLASIASLAAPADRAALAATSRARLNALTAGIPVRRIEPIGSTSQRAEARRLFPQVLIPGPLTAKYFPAETLRRVKLDKWNPVQYRLKAWATGANSIEDILRQTICEERPAVAPTLTCDFGLAYFQALAAAGLVALHDHPTA